MVNVYLDHVSTLRQVERHGVVQNLTRKARVQFTDVDIPFPNNFDVLGLATSAGAIPLPFSTLNELGYKTLVLVERRSELVEQEPGWVDVELHYEHVLAGPNQLIVPPTANQLVFGKGRVSVTEKTTNFYRPFGDPLFTFPPDINGGEDKVLIQVAHTFPPDANVVTGFEKDLPFTKRQLGEVTIPFPQSNFRIQGVVATNDPQGTADLYARTINADTFLGKPPLHWMISDVQWEMLDSEDVPRSYKFEWEFQYNFDSWDPVVVFIDQRTNRPPVGIEKAVEYDPDLYLQGILIISHTYNPIVAAPFLRPFGVSPGAPGWEVLCRQVNRGFPPQAPVQIPLQPAGYWNVPCLKRALFSRLFPLLSFES